MHSIHSRVINRRYTRRCCNRHEFFCILSSIIELWTCCYWAVLEMEERSFSKPKLSHLTPSTYEVSSVITLGFFVRNWYMMDELTTSSVSISTFYCTWSTTIEHRSFPNFFPTFPLSESYRDIVLCVIDASRRQRMVDFGPNNVLANVLYNDRYYHYARKCLHLVGFQCLYRLASFWNRSLDPSRRGRDKSRVWKCNEERRYYSWTSAVERTSSLENLLSREHSGVCLFLVYSMCKWGASD